MRRSNIQIKCPLSSPSDETSRWAAHSNPSTRHARPPPSRSCSTRRLRAPPAAASCLASHSRSCAWAKTRWPRAGTYKAPVRISNWPQMAAAVAAPRSNATPIRPRAARSSRSSPASNKSYSWRRSRLVSNSRTPLVALPARVRASSSKWPSRRCFSRFI
mgnify:CR=1 FL=1